MEESKLPEYTEEQKAALKDEFSRLDKEIQSAYRSWESTCNFSESGKDAAWDFMHLIIILLRIRDVDLGLSKSIPWEEAKARILESIQGKQREKEGGSCGQGQEEEGA